MKPLATATYNLLEALFRAGREDEHAELALAHLRAGSKVQSAFVLGAEPEKWLEFFERGLKKLFDDRAGHLYVASNDETPGWLKVGKTRLAPAERMNALNNESVTGVIRCEYSLAVHDRHYCEAAAHAWFRKRGFQRKKEFFNAPLEALQDGCARVLEEDLIRLAEADVLHLLRPRNGGASQGN